MSDLERDKSSECAEFAKSCRSMNPCRGHSEKCKRKGGEGRGKEDQVYTNMHDINESLHKSTAPIANYSTYTKNLCSLRHSSHVDLRSHKIGSKEKVQNSRRHTMREFLLSRFDCFPLCFELLPQVAPKVACACRILSIAPASPVRHTKKVWSVIVPKLQHIDDEGLCDRSSYGQEGC